MTVVNGIAIQGDYGGRDYITKFILKYTNETAGKWIPFNDGQIRTKVCVMAINFVQPFHYICFKQIKDKTGLQQLLVYNSVRWKIFF